MPSGGHFVPCRTTRLTPEDDHDLDVLKIVKSLEYSKDQIVGVQARFGGKAFDITWSTDEIAAAAASTGVDYAGRHYVLQLLGRKNLDVSVFVNCEFPDEYLIELLKHYGQFNETSIRRLKLKERGYEHIENGVRVVTFTSMDKKLPNAIFYRNTPLGFRYTGQVKLCFKCASPDHTVRDCPKRKTTEPEPEPEQQTETQQQQTSEQQHESEDEQATDNESNYATDRHETTEGESEGSDMETQDQTQRKVKRPKRTRTISPANSDSDQPAQKVQIDEKSQQTATQELFTSTTDTAETTEDATMTKRPTSPGPRLKKFLEGIKAPGRNRQALITALKPAEFYYKARGLWLQFQHGDYTADSAKRNKVNNNKDVAEWRILAGQIRQDAYGDLIRLYSEIIEVCDIFPSN